MIFVTSLSPKHISIKTQEEAIESWKAITSKIYSLNCKSEILDLKKKVEYNGVEFVEVEGTGQGLFNKPVVQIKEILTFINNLQIEANQPIAIINSDIIVKGDREILDRIEKESNNGLIFVSRYNFRESLEDGLIEKWGFDIFISTKSTFSILQQIVNDIYCMGVCFWDYWIPYTCIKKGIKTFWLNKPWAYHKEHKKQWSKRDWLLCVSTFRKDEKITSGEIRLTGTRVRRVIRERSYILE
jgi:hypothetical protein